MLRQLVPNTPLSVSHVMPYICLEENARKQTPHPRRRGVSLDPCLELTWTEGELRCRLVEGVSTARAGGRVGLFVFAGRMERRSIRAGLWLPPPNIFESGRRGNSLPVMLQDDAVITKKNQSFDFFERRGMMSHSTANVICFPFPRRIFWYQAL